MVDGNFTENAKACMARLEEDFGQGSVVAALQKDKNNLIVVILRDVIGDYCASFMMSFLHSDNGFETDTQDCLQGSWLFGKEVCNRIGLISFSTYSRENCAWLHLVEVDKGFYGHGYGSMMMDYLKSLLQNDVTINWGKKCRRIAGRFEPHGTIPIEDVKKFYLRNGCDSYMIKTHGFIEIKLTGNAPESERGRS